MNGTHTSAAHTRLSRETRHLLLAAFIALVVLWVLARVRFPDRPVTPNPIPPLLTQLSARPGFSDLASEVGRLQSRLSGSLIALSRPPSRGSGDARVALRIRSDTAVVMLPDMGASPTPDGAEVVAMDRATGLAVVRVRTGSPTLAPVPWVPDRLDAPRYLIATAVAPDGNGVSLQPVFVGGLQSADSPAWSGPLWRIPPGASISEGTLLFTDDGELAGVTTRDAGALVIVPGETLLDDAQRLIERRDALPGEIGVRAQTLTPPLSAPTGSAAGVIVTFVDPRGPAAAHLAIGDVVESFGDALVTTAREWEVWTSRLAVGERVDLSVRRRGDLRRVELVARAPAVDARRSLGLTLRWVSGLGSEIVRVESGSAAHAAGLLRGDVITAVGATALPTPAQVRGAYASARDAETLVVGLARGDGHQVLALVK